VIAYEPSDLPARGAAAAVAGLFALLLLAGVTVWIVLHFISAGEPPPEQTVVTNPPPPRLEVTPRIDRLRIEDTAEARLRADATHLSIEQAMRDIARAGWRDGATEVAQ
jgi:hypothetical protein